MNLAVAVEAVFTQQFWLARATGQALTAVGLAGVEGRGVALLAQGGPAGGQQRSLTEP